MGVTLRILPKIQRLVGKLLLYGCLPMWVSATLAQPAQSVRTPERDRAPSVYGSRPDSAFRRAKQSYTYSQEQGDQWGEAKALQEMGRLCYHLGQYPQSLDFHLQANHLYR
jgi:hypothetical protein